MIYYCCNQRNLSCSCPTFGEMTSETDVMRRHHFAAKWCHLMTSVSDERNRMTEIDTEIFMHFMPHIVIVITAAVGVCRS